MADLTVAAAGVRALLDFAASRGANRSVLAERAGIDPACLEDRDNRISFDSYVALMRAGQELCKDPALALHFGESVDLAEISFTHQIGATSMTDAMAVMNRYARLTIEVDVENSDRYELSRSGGQLWMIDRRRNPNAFPELTESGFARIICMMRRVTGVNKFVQAVHVTHAAPSYRDEYDRIFQLPVVFASDRNAFLMNEAALHFRPPVSSPYAAEVLTAHAELLLQKLDNTKSMGARVEHLLISRLKTGDVSMEAIAKEMGVSRQTLFRNLKVEGVTFEKILDELRRKTAIEYLDGGRLSVSQAAHLLGFADPAVFSRAFKRWTGVSPREYLRNRIEESSKRVI